MNARHILTLVAGLIAAQAAARTYYVTPSGSASATGNSYATAVDIKTAFAGASAGDVVLLQPGTYLIANSGAKNGFTMAKAGTATSLIRIEGDGGQAVINFQWGTNAYMKDDHGLSVTGSYYYFKNLMITQAGYNGAYVTGAHNTFDNCVFYNNRNTGLEINKGGSYTTVLNCDAYYNYDLRRGGGMADGFGPKQTMGPGNTLTGCRAWENSDDGFDLFDSPEKVIIKNCWTFRNGINVYTGVTEWGTKDGTAIDGVFKGNGNGFKLGGNSVAGDHEVYNCVSFDNVVKGFDQNSNTGSVKIYNSTGYNNGTYNFAFGGTLASGEKLDFRNNLSYGSPSGADVKNATLMNNSWTLGISFGTSDFVSLEKSLAKVARNADGSLPYTGFLVPTAASKAVDKGVDVGLPFCGAAPELGAFEVNCNKAPIISITAPANNATFTAPGPITFSVATSDPDGKVTYVDLYYDTRKLVKANPDKNGVYSIDWNYVKAGTYTLTAVATDDLGATTTSAPITITVLAANQPPVVNITAPANNATLQSPANFTITVAASDPDGTIPYIEIYNGTRLVVTANLSNGVYSIDRTIVSAGTYTFTAVATDNLGLATTSAPITITVLAANQPPVVNITAPANNASFAASASIALSATATDDGTVASVEWYSGSTLLGTGSSYQWNTSAPGTYTITAKAIDDKGLATTSAPITITVTDAVQTVELAAGWNLMSINLRPTDSTIATLFSGLDVAEIKDMDSYWRSGQAGFLSSLQSITPGQGYLVKMNTKGTLNISGTPVETGHALSLQPANWQLIGCPFPAATPIAGVLVSNFSEAKDFDGYWLPNDTQSSIDSIEPGKAYFAK